MAGLIDRWKNRGWGPDDVPDSNPVFLPMGWAVRLRAISTTVENLSTPLTSAICYWNVCACSAKTMRYWSSTKTSSNIYWSMSIRTQMQCNIYGFACSHKPITIFAVSAMTTSQIMAGAEQRSTIFYASSATSPGRRLSALNAITARRRIFWPPHRGLSLPMRDALAKSFGPT